MAIPYNPEWNKMAGSPYASLSSYYKMPVQQGGGHQKPVKFAVPEFGAPGYNVPKVAPNAKKSTCHVWRAGDYDGRALSKDAYPQCGPGSKCDQYISRY